MTIEDVNTASNVVQTAHPQVTPISKGTTADDLLDMYDEIDEGKEQEISSEVEKQLKVQEQLPKKQAANELAKKIEDKEESENTAKKEADNEKEIDKETELKTGKKLKAKHEGEELEIPEDAEVLVPINGKEVPVPVKEMVREFTKLEERTRTLDRRWSHIDRREKDFEAELNKIQTGFKNIAEHAASGDYMAAVKLLAQMGGKNPVDYERHVLDQLHSVTKEWMEMTPAERDHFTLKRRNDYLEKQNKKTEEEKQQIAGRTALEQKVEKLISDNGLTKDSFWMLYKELVESGQVPNPEALEPENIIEYHQHKTAADKAVNAIKSVNEKLLDDDEIFEEITGIALKNPNYTVDDVKQILEDALQSNQSVESLNKKVQKANSTGHRAQSSQVSSKKIETSELDEELYEEWFGKRPVSRR